MKKADRLMKITHFLREQRRAVKAEHIAQKFSVCTRTVYRDIQALMDNHVPIRGEAGVGYVINKSYYLPPIAFDHEELEAIALGINMVRQWTDEAFADTAQSALEKIQAVLPENLQGELQQITTYAIPNRPMIAWTVRFSTLRECIRAQRKILIDYKDAKQAATTRTLRPLALLFFNPVWLLAAWCETRVAFRNFRLDRIEHLKVCEAVFADEEGKDLRAYIQQEADCIE